MMSRRRGRYIARFAEVETDVQAAQALRWLCFMAKHGLAPDDGALDADPYDASCRHVLIEDARNGELVCCCRVRLFNGGGSITESYAAQYYGLAGLRDFDGRMLEMGRFCIRPGRQDPDILRVAWGALAGIVDDEGVEMLFGCSSFMGIDPDGYADAFAMLKERHLAPKRWLPRVKAPDVFRFARALRRRQPDARLAMRLMPPLLRSYLMMGGWVSDHAVVDRQLNTLHVFTGLEIRSIPPARARILRGVAAP